MTTRCTVPHGDTEEGRLPAPRGRPREDRDAVADRQIRRAGGGPGVTGGGSGVPGCAGAGASDDRPQSGPEAAGGADGCASPGSAYTPSVRWPDRANGPLPAVRLCPGAAGEQGGLAMTHRTHTRTCRRCRPRRRGGPVGAGQPGHGGCGTAEARLADALGRNRAQNPTRSSISGPAPCGPAAAPGLAADRGRPAAPANSAHERECRRAPGGEPSMRPGSS